MIVGEMRYKKMRIVSQNKLTDVPYDSAVFNIITENRYNGDDDDEFVVYGIVPGGYEYEFGRYLKKETALAEFQRMRKCYMESYGRDGFDIFEFE